MPRKYWSPTERGFFDEITHAGSMPEDAVEISDETAARLLAALDAGEGVAMVDGAPVPVAAPPLSIGVLQDRAGAAWEVEVKAARAQIAGTDDPVKLAEYADKAAQAPAILAGTASAAIVAEAEAEAARIGLADAGAIAALWIEMAEGLRAARTRMNLLAPDHAARIAAAEDAAGIGAALAAGRAALADLISEFAPEESENA